MKKTLLIVAAACVLAAPTVAVAGGKCSQTQSFWGLWKPPPCR